MFIFALMNHVDCRIGFEYVRDLHSDLTPAMARYSLVLTGSPVHFRAFFNVQPHVISGHQFGLECATQPISNCRGARVIGTQAKKKIGH
jgi:hypothetical protein